MERTINNLLAFLCDVDGFTQKEIADRIGIAQSHLSEIYSGNAVVSLDLLFKFAEVHRCLTGDLLNLIEIDLYCNERRKELLSERIYAIGILFQDRCKRGAK